MELSKIYSGKSRNNEIIVIDNNFYSQRVSQLKRWNISFYQKDILDIESCKDIFKNADIIFHLAGVTNVATTKNDIDKERDFVINEVGIQGTRNILNSVSKKTKIIFPSTHVIFEGLPNLKKAIGESETPQPELIYSKGKYQSEQDLINSGLNYVILRLGSVYGNSFDSTRFNIMPNLFSKITSTSGTIKLYSGGNQLKSIVSVKDVSRCLEYVGENDQINNEILNCVSENFTVKQIAEICKKLNKNIEIVSSDDPVPNLGYSLSNKKILNLGFEFKYNFKNSLKEFLNYFSEFPKITTNEVIELGQDNFVDNRGVISNYYLPDYVNMLGYIESKKGTVRGNHYHPQQTQKCLLISGSYVSITKDLSDKHSVIETRLLKPGDLSTIPPYVAHTMIFLEDSVFINLVNGEREHKNYGVTHTIREELVNENLASFISKNYKSECRVCNSNNLKLYLSLGLSPLANNLLDNKSDKFTTFPLEVNFCCECFNSQLSVVVPRKLMFDNYLYLSSTTEHFKKHFEKLANKLVKDFNLKSSSKIVDIGSNDGIFLKPLKEAGLKHLGVEPAKNVAKIANDQGLNTLVGYFDKKIASKILKNFGKVDIVTAFNVFAHGDDLRDILKNTETILKRNGTFIFEVQNIVDTIQDLTFDNIYHEHVNYWSVTTLLKFFQNSNLKIFKIEKIDTHGGSIRVYASNDKNKKIHKSVGNFVVSEKDFGIHLFSTYLNFAKKVKSTKTKSLNKILDLSDKNKRVVAYGAPAKATTVLNYFGISNNEFEFTIDDNILKHNKYIPGTGIQIKNPKDVNLKEIDVVIVLAWNFFDQIKKYVSQKSKKIKILNLK